MIIGSGLIARLFAPRYVNHSRVTLCCAGVSNSLETDGRAFQREENLLAHALEKSHGRSRFIYFSTCSATAPATSHTPYIRHKLTMEDRVREHPDHLIFRLPQIAGLSRNPHTLLNYLFYKIFHEEHFDLWLGSRPNIIDGDDMVQLCSKILDEYDITKVIPPELRASRSRFTRPWPTAVLG